MPFVVCWTSMVCLASKVLTKTNTTTSLLTAAGLKCPPAALQLLLSCPRSWMWNPCRPRLRSNTVPHNFVSPSLWNFFYFYEMKWVPRIHIQDQGWSGFPTRAGQAHGCGAGFGRLRTQLNQCFVMTLIQKMAQIGSCDILLLQGKRDL